MPKGIFTRPVDIGQKISKALKGKPRPFQSGERHGMWKGENISYIGIHSWNNEHYPKTGICTKCLSVSKTEWALIHGKEHARGIENYQELCIPCHRKYDHEGRPAWNKGNVAIYPKKCEFCLKDFNGKKKISRFCSNVCSGKWRFNKGLTRLLPGSNEFNRLELNKK